MTALDTDLDTDPIIQITTAGELPDRRESALPPGFTDREVLQSSPSRFPDEAQPVPLLYDTDAPWYDPLEAPAPDEQPLPSKSIVGPFDAYAAVVEKVFSGGADPVLGFTQSIVARRSGIHYGTNNEPKSRKDGAAAGNPTNSVVLATPWPARHDQAAYLVAAGDYVTILSGRNGRHFYLADDLPFAAVVVKAEASAKEDEAGGVGWAKLKVRRQSLSADPSSAVATLADLQTAAAADVEYDYVNVLGPLTQPHNYRVGDYVWVSRRGLYYFVIPARETFPAILVNAGPDSEADFANPRYWVREIYGDNVAWTNNQQTSTDKALTAVDSTGSGGRAGRWVMAWNLHELTADSHQHKVVASPADDGAVQAGSIYVLVHAYADPDTGIGWYAFERGFEYVGDGANLVAAISTNASGQKVITHNTMQADDASGITFYAPDSAAAGAPSAPYFTLKAYAESVDANKHGQIAVGGTTYYIEIVNLSSLYHAILDGATHSDSVAQGVTRGSLIVGNATPKWDELIIGPAGGYLSTDGTDAAWAPVSDIDHDSLTNYDANEHIDHTTVSISSGGILSGGGTIAANRTISLAHGDVDHDQTANFVGNEHIDHSTISIVAGTGIDGGGLITGNVDLSINEGEIDHDGLFNWVGDKHIDWTGTASNLLTSGNITIDSDSSGLVLGDGQDATLKWDNANARVDLNKPIAINGTHKVYQQADGTLNNTNTGIMLFGHDDLASIYIRCYITSHSAPGRQYWESSGRMYFQTLDGHMTFSAGGTGRYFNVISNGSVYFSFPEGATPDTYRLIVRNKTDAYAEIFTINSNGDVQMDGDLDCDGNADVAGNLTVAKELILGTTTLSSDTDALDVGNISVVLVDTGSGNVTIGGLANGVAGQIVHILKIDSANDLTLEHDEAAGTQKIFTPETSDRLFTHYGGVTLIYSGTNWYVLNYPFT